MMAINRSMGWSEGLDKFEMTSSSILESILINKEEADLLSKVKAPGATIAPVLPKSNC